MHMRLLKQLSASRTWARWPARLLVGVLAGSFFLFLGIPLAALIIREPPAMLWQAIQRPESSEALQLSLITTTISTLLTLVFGIPVAYILARLHFPGRNLLETLVTMPTVLPPVVAGVALLITFGRFGLLSESVGDRAAFYHCGGRHGADVRLLPFLHQ